MLYRYFPCDGCSGFIKVDSLIAKVMFYPNGRVKPHNLLLCEQCIDWLYFRFEQELEPNLFLPPKKECDA